MATRTQNPSPETQRESLDRGSSPVTGPIPPRGRTVDDSSAGEEDPDAGLDDPDMRDAMQGEAEHARTPRR